MNVIRKKLIIVILITIIIIGISVICNLSNFENSTTVKIGIVDSYIPEEILNNKNVKNVNYTNLNSSYVKSNHGLITLQLILNECKNNNIFYSSVLDEKNIGQIDTIISGIQWCIDQDVDIICMSFATTDNNILLEKTIKSAIDKNIIVVSSCINFSNIDCYPAMYRNVISVSEGANKNASIILPNKIFSVNMNDKDIIVKGTSALTAYVAGYISNEVSKGNIEIEEILKKIN